MLVLNISKGKGLTTRADIERHGSVDNINSWSTVQFMEWVASTDLKPFAPLLTGQNIAGDVIAHMNMGVVVAMLGLHDVFAEGQSIVLMSDLQERARQQSTT